METKLSAGFIIVTFRGDLKRSVARKVQKVIRKVIMPMSKDNPTGYFYDRGVKEWVIVDTERNRLILSEAQDRFVASPRQLTILPKLSPTILTDDFLLAQKFSRALLAVR